MARRRQPLAPAPSAATVPAELRACAVGDWLTSRELLGETSWGIDPVVVAWGRWRRARRAWLDEHDLPPSTIASRRPLMRGEYSP